MIAVSGSASMLAVNVGSLYVGHVLIGLPHIYTVLARVSVQHVVKSLGISSLRSADVEVFNKEKADAEMVYDVALTAT